MRVSSRLIDCVHVTSALPLAVHAGRIGRPGHVRRQRDRRAPAATQRRAPTTRTCWRPASIRFQNATACVAFGCRPVSAATACPASHCRTSFGVHAPACSCASRRRRVEPRRAAEPATRRAPHISLPLVPAGPLVIQVASALPLASMVTRAGPPARCRPRRQPSTSRPAVASSRRRLSARRSSRRSSRHRATSGRKVNQACSATTTTRRRSWRHRRARTARARRHDHPCNGFHRNPLIFVPAHSRLPFALTMPRIDQPIDTILFNRHGNRRPLTLNHDDPVARSTRTPPADRAPVGQRGRRQVVYRRMSVTAGCILIQAVRIQGGVASTVSDFHFAWPAFDAAAGACARSRPKRPVRYDTRRAKRLT